MIGVPNVGQTVAASRPVNLHRQAMLHALLKPPTVPAPPAPKMSMPPKAGC